MYDFTKPKQKFLPVKLLNGKVVVLLPPNGYILEAIQDLQSSKEDESVKVIYDILFEILNHNKNHVKISRDEILNYTISDIQNFITNDYMDFILSIQKNPN